MVDDDKKLSDDLQTSKSFDLGTSKKDFAGDFMNISKSKTNSKESENTKMFERCLY